MKCLSLKQPYAELLVSGQKTIELRTWNTKFRGEFLIHASKKIDRQACDSLKIDPHQLTKGAIVGKATLTDVKFYHDSKSFLRDKNKHHSNARFVKKLYVFKISNAHKFRKPTLMNGRLGFFNVEY
jgi:hypothetical protein